MTANQATEALAKLAAIGAGRQARALLGCDWGRRISLPGDDEPCLLAADRQIVLHAGGAEMFVKLCDGHAAIVETQTEPHTPCGRPGCPGCDPGART
jgi:hypothetical protein